MFEHYTEKARRAVFFARYEASQFGTARIETEHLLLGVLREDTSLARRFLRTAVSVDTIRKQIEGRVTVGEKHPTSVDIPMSDECKRALAFARDEAERLSQVDVGTEHLFAGLLQEEGSLAAQILRECGASLAAVREHLAEAQREKAVVTPSKKASVLAEFSRDLMQEVSDSQSDPFIGREKELDQLIEILCRRSKNNAVLIGEAGVGKAAMVKALARRIVENNVPPELAGKRIMGFYLSSLIAGSRGSEERVAAVISELAEAREIIIFIEDLFVAPDREDSLDAANLLRPSLSRGQLRCIASATPSDYRASIERAPWLERPFHAVTIPAPDEDDAVKILFGIRDRYEKFHGVSYTDEALQYSVRYSNRYVPHRCLPDKAIDLIDEAGAHVKVRPQILPAEVSDCQRRINFLNQHMDNATAQHELEKARFYSDELAKEKETLRLLQQKHKLGEAVERVVTRRDIEEVVARWTGIPVSEIGQEGEQ
jgi:ATP-dependent Clp protease ATP-binding subunit ClpC